MEVNIYIGVWTLKPKCTQYGLYGRATFKNAKVKTGQGQAGQGRAGHGQGTEALAFSVMPLPAALTHAMLVGGI
jgi:hypothetical protein